MIKNIILTLIGFVISGCGYFIPIKIKNSFTYCYDDKNTGLDTLININGFYYIKKKQNINKVSLVYSQDTLYPSFVFFEKGFIQVDPGLDILLQTKRSKIQKYFDNLWGEYGKYKLCGDTIKAQYVDPPGGMTWEMAEIWFKIINKNTISIIYIGDGNEITSEYVKSSKQNDTCIFSPLNEKIDPNKTWIIKKKWFRCKNRKKTIKI